MVNENLPSYFRRILQINACAALGRELYKNVYSDINSLMSECYDNPEVGELPYMK